MAKKKRIYKDHIEYATQSASPFLRLPPELRTLIYREALVKNDGIDLWPDLPIADFADHPDLIERVKHLDRSKLDFRHQRDLEFVRRHLAVALLTTCRQIRDEAFAIFWTENQFRFSADFEWVGIKRFLLTIGPAARALLRTLEVAPPDHACTPALGRATAWSHLKNHPKLHMAKLFGHSTSNPLWQTPGNFAWVSNMIQEDRTLSTLKFILPSGRSLFQNHHSRPVEFDERFDPLRFLNLSLVVEKGAILTGPHDIEHCTSQGLAVVAMQGALIAPQFPLSWADPPRFQPEVIEEMQSWSSPLARDEDADEWLLDVCRLFDESFCNHAARTRTQEKRGYKPIMRPLKGFGGCRFVDRSYWDTRYIEVRNRTRYERKKTEEAAIRAAR